LLNTTRLQARPPPGRIRVWIQHRGEAAAWA